MTDNVVLSGCKGKKVGETMESLDHITKVELIRIPDFKLEKFQKEVMDNLYLEFFLKQCRVLITPELNYMLTGQASEEEQSALEEILFERKEFIKKLKVYLIYNLSLYSSLLETNSYYISLNNHLTISRFVPVEGTSDLFEVKLYTIGRHDLPENYKDKIYIGRDFVSLKSIQREHLGLKNMKNSVVDQLIKLKERLSRFLSDEVVNQLQSEYVQELEELIGEFSDSSTNLMDSFPVEISSKSLESEALIEVNGLFRDLKHILIEMEETLREMENELFENDHSRAVRYVTKFRKDIVNLINYIALKVNGRINDSVNGIHQ